MSMSLAALEILEQAKFPPAQARAIARVFETEAAHRADLVTKGDLKADLAAFVTKSDWVQLEARLEVKIESVKTDCLRWTFLMVIGQMTLLTGIMYFLLQNLR